MKRTLACGLVAGAAAAVATGISEAALGTGAPFSLTALTAVGLLLPLGIATGLGLLAFRAMLPPERRPSRLFGALMSKDDAGAAGSILAAGLLSIAALPVAHGIVLFFLEGFHHHGLAALALTFSLAVFLVVVMIVGKRLRASARRFVSWMPRPLRRPLIWAMMIAAAWAIAVIPPLVDGPEATGVFGFVGLLRKDGLGAAPLIMVAFMALVAGALLWVLLGRATKWLIPAAALAAVLALFGPFLAASIIGAYPTVLDRLDSAGGPAHLTGKLCRRLGDSDGDGHARWMGGRDCDDRDPSIHPGAREIPDNGIDEDCSGADLSLAALAARRREGGDPVEGAKETRRVMRRPDLPEDVSLFLITVDTLRWNAPGFMGAERDVTPNLDALVKGGTIYDRAYALGSYTGQAIPPLLTGKYASELHRNNRHETKISEKETFAAELVCGPKVKCGAVLSHFLFDRQFGWSQGFHDWIMASSLPQEQISRDLKYNSHSVAAKAIEWLSKPENTEGSFWLWTHFMDPHKEYIEHPGFRKFGDDKRDMYDHEVLFTDHHIGEMLARFRELPAAARTIIIVTADHGEAFNEHGRWCHGKELWEEIIRVPLAVAGPGVASKRIARQTSQVDLFATILDLFGVEAPEGIHGRSLVPEWVEGQELPERPVIADQPRNPYYETRRVFIKDGWKLHDLPDTGTHRLYRITEDYERGDSLVEAEPEAFARIKEAYELFMATEFESIPAVDHGGDYRTMPEPPGSRRRR